MANRRKPNHLKVLEGTDRPDRMHDEPDLPEPDSTDPPDWLNSPAAINEWNRVVGLLTDVRTLSAGDLTMLGHLCNHHAMCVRRWELGDSPSAADLTQLRLMYTEFGLTPASRSKASQLGEGTDSNAFSKLSKNEKGA